MSAPRHTTGPSSGSFHGSFRVRKFIRALARRPLLAVSVVALGVASAIWFSLAIETRYRAVATFNLVRTSPGLDIRAVIAERDRAIASRTSVPRDATVDVFATPGNPAVVVVASAEDAEDARNLANVRATELAAADLGVDRAAIAQEMRDLRLRLTRFRRGDPGRNRLEMRLRALARRQVNDERITAALTATKVAGPAPVRNALIMVPVALLLAVGAVVASDAVRRR